MPKSDKQLEEGDLTWFKLERYAPDALNSLGLQGWISALIHRLLIWEGAKRGELRVAKFYFQRLLNAPDFPAMGRIAPLTTLHASDTPTVRLATLGVVQLLGRDAELDPTNFFVAFDDVKLKQSQSRRRATVTLHVNLAGSRSQIKQDFLRWLEGVDYFHPAPTRRDFGAGGAAISEWIEAKYLPAFDLELCALLKGKILPQELLASKLGLQSKVEAADRNIQDVVRTPKRALKVFSKETLIDMYLQLSAIAQQDQATNHRVSRRRQTPQKNSKASASRRKKPAHSNTAQQNWMGPLSK